MSDPRRYNECYLNGSVFIYLFFSGSIIGVVQMVNKKSGVFTASGDYVIKRSELVYTQKLGIKRSNYVRKKITKLMFRELARVFRSQTNDLILIDSIREN